MQKKSWQIINKILESFKKVPLFRWLYKLPWAPSLYHYSLALLGAIIYRMPSRRTVVVGVTGTKGKTTTLELINAGLEAAGLRTALLSSHRIKVGEKSEKNLLGNTQPGRFYIQAFLREAVSQGCTHVLLEIPSEGVVRHRHRFISFDGAAFINLHPEHIESHGSFEKYRDAKVKFFKDVERGVFKSKDRFFVVNRDDPNANYFIKEVDSERLILATRTSKKIGHRGKFNLENAGIAEAVLHRLGIGDDIVTAAFQRFDGVPGRMEFVQEAPFSIIVDYAHTPDSLEAVYTSLKEEEKPNKLICVLGSAGGGRDKWKRPEMGRVAGEHCDKIFLTNEDPFDEEPDQILEEIEGGITAGKRRKVKRIIDRKEAIEEAIKAAAKGDVVIITGKGSEPYLRVKNGEKIPWSDVGVAKEAISNKN